MFAGIILMRTLMRQNVSTAGLEVPTQEYVLENGYPTNARGETYGPNVGDMPSPDLILAVNEDGVEGYIKLAEMDYNPSTPEEAGEISAYTGTLYYNMYLQDGETIVGKFEVSTTSETDISGIDIE